MFLEHVKAFLAHPFDPNNDGQTSALEWFAFLGLLIVLVAAWNFILHLMFAAE